MSAKSVRERVINYAVEHPRDSFNIESLVRVFGKEFEPQLRVIVPELAKRDRTSIFRVVLLKDSFKKGFYRFNPEYKTLEQMREEAAEAGRERVVAGAQKFDPKVSPIIGEDLSVRRLFFKSILDRMSKNVAFSAADVEMLKTELPLLAGNGES